MAYHVRKELDAFMYAAAKAITDQRIESTAKDGYFHKDVTSTTSGDFTDPVSAAVTVTAANATDLATSITLANQLKKVYNLHCADAVGHKVADTTNTISTADATALASVEALLNAIKAAFNLHIASTTFHYNADSTNTVATANATDQTTSNALANAIKTALNAHMASAPAGHGLDLIGP